MLLEGRIIVDGMDLIRYLDAKFEEIKRINHTTTGIIIGTTARQWLSTACQKVMGQPQKNEVTINRFRGTLLIEDGMNLERLEVLHAKAPMIPVEGNPFTMGRK